MIEIIASIITTLALIWLASHDFSKKPTQPKRSQTRDHKGRYLPLQVTYVAPRFFHVDERTLVRV